MLGVMAGTLDNTTALQTQQVMSREKPEVPEGRGALVLEILEKIKADKEHWDKNFKRMRYWQRFARGYQWEQALAMEGEELTQDDEKYVANIVQRHIQQEVASLYAKNPTVVAKRAERMDFQVWDGKMSTVQNAMMMAQGGMVDPMNPMGSPIGMQAMMLLQDIAQGVSRRMMLDRVAKSMQILYKHNMDEHQPNLKRQFKKLIRRAKICGVGYVKLGFQRAMAHSPDSMQNIQDITQRIATMQQISADMADGKTSSDSADAEKLRLALQDLEKQPDVIVYEGLVWNFPRSTAIIPDMETVALDGWVGTNHVSEEFPMTATRIKQVYGIDVESCSPAGGKSDDSNKNTFQIIRRRKKKRGNEQEHLVYIHYDKLTGLEYHVCDGYPDFLKEPESPYPRLERFFPYFPLVLNDVEDEDDIFPLSDVELMYSQQKEHNEAREGLSQHRKHNKPFYVSKKELEKEDKEKLKNREAFEILTLASTNSQESVNDIIQPFGGTPVDPNLYSTEHLQNDMALTVGADPAGVGALQGSGDVTASASTIAEGARTKSTSSNVDDLDDLLTELAREGGVVLLAEMSPQTVTQIVGPGAVWPEWSRSEIAQEIYLTIEAGSSGRPNRAQDLANFERAAPLIMQIPGISPEAFGRYGVKILDDKIDLDEMLIEGLPSMVAMNALASRPQDAAPGEEAGQPEKPSNKTGDARNNPSQQGAEGQNNAPQPDRTQPGGQPGMQMVRYDQMGNRV